MHSVKPSHEVTVSDPAELTDQEFQHYLAAREQSHRQAQSWVFLVIIAGLIVLPTGIFLVRWSLGLL